MNARSAGQAAGLSPGCSCEDDLCCRADENDDFDGAPSGSGIDLKAQWADQISSILDPIEERFEGVALPDRLRSDERAWRAVPRFIRRLIVHGVSGIFCKLPSEFCFVPPVSCAEKDHDKLLEEVFDLEALGVVSQCEFSSMRFMHKVFIHKKISSAGITKFRLIADLRHINQYVRRERFQMQTFKDARRLLQLRDSMAKLDLSRAYYHVPISIALKRFLCFAVELQDGSQAYFQWNSLPFGLSDACWLFTCLMRAILKRFRFATPCTVLDYLDDVLISGSSSKVVLREWLSLIWYLANLGFCINRDKCFGPSCVQEFLGYTIDTTTMRFSVSEVRISKCRRDIRTLLRRGYGSPRKLAAMLGQVAFMAAAIPRLSARFTRTHKFKCRILHQHSHDWDYSSVLPLEIVKELNSAHLYLQSCERSELLRYRLCDFDYVLETDSSLFGYGAVLKHRGSTIAELAGHWPKSLDAAHINVKELRAIAISLDEFRDLILGSKILIRCDNVCAVSCVRKGQNSVNVELNAVAHSIMHRANQFGYALRAIHLQGELNVRADVLSRMRYDNQDWTVNSDCFEILLSIVAAFGIVPVVDLFATRKNRRLSNFVSRFFQRGCRFADAFSASWRQFACIYANPPFLLWPSVLAKLIEDGVLGVFVVPVWPSRPWWGLMKQCSVVAVEMRRTSGTFIPCSGGGVDPPKWRTLVVLATANPEVRQSLSPILHQSWLNWKSEVFKNEQWPHIQEHFVISKDFVCHENYLAGLRVLS